MSGTWRTVRVFISSTFRDMHAERDHLVKVVFPALRERLLPYRVELLDIDLRWGVTREQAENEQVITFCLEQIDECRPFFLGVLGDRYGWVLPRLPTETLRRFPWTADDSGASVTELEIRHGVFNADGAARRALVCVRDPDSLATIPEPTRSAVFAETNPEARHRLEALKQFLSAGGHTAVEPYPCRWEANAYDRPTRSLGRLVGLEAFGRQVHDWLWEAIRAELNLPDQPAVGDGDPLAEEADFHERLMELRLRVYAGREQLNEALYAYALGNSELPCLMTGPSGSGKSAALARFVTSFRRQHPEVFVLAHFVGASPRSTSLREMLGRLCGELKQRFGFGLAIPETTAERMTTFLGFVASVPAQTRVVLVLDAVNQLDAADGAHALAWLSERLPPHVKLLASCLADPRTPHPVLVASRRRQVQAVPVEPLTDADRREIIRAVPKLTAKTLDERQVSLLVANPATANPLFLMVALEELRGFGSFEHLNQRIADLPSGDDAVTGLFGQVFERLEEEFDRELVQSVLKLLASSRHGLSERELQDLTATLAGKDDLFPVLRQLRPYLLSRAGLLDGYHANVATAIRQRYLPTEAERPAVHLRLADYFVGRDLDERKAAEFPWQLAEARAWQRLAAVLADLPFFAAAWRAGEFEVKELWGRVEKESPLRMVEAYRPVMEDPKKYHEYVWKIAALLGDTGHTAEALVLGAYRVEHYRQVDDPAELQDCLGDQAFILMRRGDLDEAMALLQQQEEICRLNDPAGLQRSLGGQALILRNRGDLETAQTLLRQQEEICRRLSDTAGLSACLCNQALILMDRGKPDEAMILLQQEEEICRRLNDPTALQLTLGNQAVILMGWGELDKAMILCKQQEEICRRINDPAGLHLTLGKQALIRKACGDLDGAMALHKQEEEICRRLNDPLGLQRCLSNQAVILIARGELDQAMLLLQQQEEICRRLDVPAALSTCLGKQALIRKACGDLDGAMALHKQEEEICRRLDSPAGLQLTLGNQAVILMNRGDLEGAMTLYKRQEEICRRLNDPEGMARSLGSQALILAARGDSDTAMTLHKQEEDMCRRLNDPAGLGRSLGNQALILAARGDLDGALALHKQVEEISRRLKDPAGLGSSLGNQALILRDRGELDKAMALHRQEEEIWRQLNDPASLSDCLGNQAGILIARAEFDQAMLLLQEQEEICRRLNDPARLGRSLNNQALILRDRGELEKAMTLYKQGEEICCRLKDPAGLGRCLGNQAMILRDRGDLDEAMILLKQVEEISRQLDLPADLSICLGNQALILGDRGDWEGAMALHKQEEEICRRLGDAAGLGRTLLNQAIILRARDDLDGALLLLKTVEEIYRRLNDPGGLGRSLGNQALILMDRGELDEAMTLYKQQEEICRRLDDPAGLSTCLGNQALILRDRGDLDGALALHKQEEAICRRNDPKGLAISLINQASLLANDKMQPRQGLPLAEEAYHLASRHGFTALVNHIRPILERIRTQARSHSKPLLP
jgi:tetratricopeptide (TPR) repeat protein